LQGRTKSPPYSSSLFETDDDRCAYVIRLPVHPLAQLPADQVTTEVTMEVTMDVTAPALTGGKWPARPGIPWNWVVTEPLDFKWCYYYPP
jgi:hypothetical protein